jgi:ABC-type multidrug transport system fused ATPase/permease subunit
VRHFIDQAVQGAAPDPLAFAALCFLGAGAVGSLFSVGTAYVGNDIAWKATNSLRQDLVAHCLGLDLNFHNSRTPGELIERLDGDVGVLAGFFSQLVLAVMANLLLLIGALLALFIEDWRVGLLLSCFVLVTMGLLSRYREAALPHWQAGRQASAELFAFIGERLGGIDDIRANGASQYTMRRFYTLERTYFRTRREARFTSDLITIGLSLVLVLGTAIGLGLAAYLLQAGEFTIGGVYLVTHYAAFLAQPIGALVFKADDLQKAGASIARIRQLQAASPKIVDGRSAYSPAQPLTVELRGVSFAYGENDRVLRDLDLHLTRGHALGLLGRTGSGKTTITRLLVRFYDPLQGAVLFDGIDLRDCKTRDLRRAVGLVTQDVQLFHASVRDNLCFFDPSICDERIKETLYELELGNWLERLPGNLNTILTPNGADLSSGEAQLLAFARVFLKDPQLVILDEASSRLDPQTEARIENAIDRLLKGRTALIIAHHLHTLDRADDIAILEQGRLIEKGEASRLRQDPDSRFAQLLRQGIEEHLA